VEFRVKICGITNAEDAVAAVEAGADAIGLNFYEKSPRCVSVADARRIVDAMERAHCTVIPIGVFVNHSSDKVRQVWEESRLAAVQLHGDEPPEMLSALVPIPVVRVWRFDERGVQAIVQDLAACSEKGAKPVSVLIDAWSPNHYGGTGGTISWAELADHPRWLNLPLILAGGLTSENVAEAIRIVRPQSVDVASGVESAPGKKDVAKMRDFVATARAAFAAR